MLVSLASVTENVFRHVTEVEIQLTDVGLVLSFIERVHHPELDIFDVGGVEVRRLDGSHDTAPTVFRIGESTVVVDVVGVVVVRTAVFWIIGEVENRHVGRRSCLDVTVRVQLGEKHLTHAVVGQLLVGDVGRQKVAVSVVEHRLVDGVPCEFGAVFAVFKSCHATFREQMALMLRRACQMPEVPLVHVDGRLGAFKIVDV